MDKIYQLRYLPLFYADLEQAVMYIRFTKSSKCGKAD